MGGGLLQLVAYGAQDIYLTGNPQITFFKVIYRRHTNFSMECVQQTLSGVSAAVATGTSKATAVISRNGDLLHQVWVQCDQNIEYGISGDYIIEEAQIEIGGQLIDKHTREWNQVWAELTTPVSKSDGYKYLTSGFNSSVSTYNHFTHQNIVMAPLQFWFCRDIGLALPLIALQYHEVVIKFTWGSGAAAAGMSRTGGGNVTPSFEVWADYVYLDTDERRRFAQVSHEYLIEQVQIQSEGNIQSSYKLNFDHPVKELIWTTQESASNPPASDTITTQQIRLELNGHDRFSQQPREYFQIKQPLLHHTSIPGFNIKEVENPIPLAKPIHVTRGTAVSVAGTPTSDGEFQVLATATSNLKIYSTNASDIDLKVGDILLISYPILLTSDDPQLISIQSVVTKINTEPSNNGVAIYTIGHTNGMGSLTDGVVALQVSLAGSGSISVVSRTQGPQSRCSQLNRNINVYSFAIHPEDHQPSGTCNFSKIDHAKLLLSDDGQIENIYAVNYNVLRIMSGMGGLAYSS